MLEYLHVKNLALLEECELILGPGLNILTGETGAGKSVLLGSVNLALGARGDKEMIRQGADEAYVELSFSMNDEVRVKLAEMDISADDDAVFISRKITQTKNVFKINGEIATAKQVKEIAGELIDIHGQHEHQSLLSNVRQREMLDAYGGELIAKQLSIVSEACKNVSALKVELSEAEALGSGREREISLLRYECEEIENANLVVGEDEELEENYKRMLASEKLMDASNEALSYISSDQSECASSLISRALNSLRRASNVDESLIDLVDKLSEAEELIGDFSISMADYIDGLEYAPEEFSETEERLNLINSLKSRFGNSIPEILASYEGKRTTLDKLENLEGYINKLKSDYDNALSIYLSEARKLSNLRKETSLKFSKELTLELEALSFLEVSFEALVSSDEEVISNKGFDTIEFMISTNPGNPKRPMKQIASGGELSRIMLGIKAILAREDSIDALIFDEIDAGISGRTAWEVAKKLNKLSKEHQVIAITHLAQIAAMADSHYEIVKGVVDGSTKTMINKLSEDGEIKELARLLGSDELDEASIKNAKELKDKAKAGKI